MPEVDFHKSIENGWTLEDIIVDMDIEIGSIMNGTSFRDPFDNPKELEKYIAWNLKSYTEKNLPEILDYFKWKYNL